MYGGRDYLTISYIQAIANKISAIMILYIFKMLVSPKKNLTTGYLVTAFQH